MDSLSQFLDHFVGTMNNIANAYIDTFLLSTMALRHAKNSTQTNQHITWLTPEIIQPLELCKTFQKISQDENSSILYFKQKILCSDEENHIECDEPSSHGRAHYERGALEFQEYLIIILSS